MMNDAYMPAPSRNAARFAVHTARTRISFMSISGFELRTSTATHATQKSAPIAIQKIVLLEPHPHIDVLLTAISTTLMPMLMSPAASQLILPGTRTGDSGTKRHVQN